MPLNELLPKAIKLYPHREAVVCGDVRMSYREFGERVWKLCHGLRALGLCRMDRVAILHENCHIFLETYFAAAHLGLILVPLNFRLDARELAVILADSGAKVLIAQGMFRDKSAFLLGMVPNLEKIVWRRRASEPALGAKEYDYEELIVSQEEDSVMDLALEDDDSANTRTRASPRAAGGVQRDPRGGPSCKGCLSPADVWFDRA